MKKLRKNLLTFILCFCCMLSVSQTAHAEVKEEVLFTLREPQDIVVTIAYGVNDVSFALVSPSGFEVTKETDTETITVFTGSTSTIVFMGQAEAGEWKIRYDKGSNESISVSADVQDTSFFITDFRMGTVSEGKVPVTFTVSANSSLSYNYRIMLTTDKETLNGREVASGRGRVDEIVEKEIVLDHVNSYDNYYLMLYVYYDLNGAEIFDYSYSESFALTNPNVPDAMENLDVTVNYDSGVMDIDWKNYLPGGASGVYLEGYIGEECVLSEEYPKENGYSAALSFRPGDVLRLEISYKNREGVISQLLSKEVDTAQRLILPESGKVGSDIWTFSYDGMRNTEVTFEVNGKEKSLVLDGLGSKYLTLPESRNKMVISYMDEAGILHRYQRDANISKVQPTIALLRQVDGVTTAEDVIMITGTTNGESLTVNGQVVEIKDGEFAYPYALTGGENHIELEAVIGDISTTLNAVVVQEKKADIPWQYLCGGLAVSMGGILLLMLAGRKPKKDSAMAASQIGLQTAQQAEDVNAKKKKLKVPGIRANWIWVAICGVLWLGLVIYTSSVAYLELAYKSALTAKILLVVMRALLWGALALAVLALIRILIQLAQKKWKERKQKREEGTNAETK